MYSLIRVGLFAVVLAFLLVLNLEPWIAAVIAAVIALCLSYIFLRKPREEVARGLYEARHSDAQVPPRAPGQKGSDEASEDAARGDAAARLEGDSGGETETEHKPG